MECFLHLLLSRSLDNDRRQDFSQPVKRLSQCGIRPLLGYASGVMWIVVHTKLRLVSLRFQQCARANAEGLLERLQIPKIDPKLLAKFVGRDRTIEQATLSEKRHASLGLHSFRHTNATAMDSLGIALSVRKQRIGHSAGTVTELYTHTFTQDERAAAEKLGELFGTGWPETDGEN